MKQFVFMAACFLFLTNCGDKPNSASGSSTPSVLNDSIQITATIHGFFEWYDAMQRDTSRPFDITDDSGKHLKINQTALKTYLGEFMKSGFVTESFITGEFEYYEKCEKLWQNEEIGDVPSGMDVDKILCAQDGDITFWTKSPVRIVNTDGTHAKATLYASDANGDLERSYELKKENGKWLLSKIVCDTGIE